MGCAKKDKLHFTVIKHNCTRKLVHFLFRLINSDFCRVQSFSDCKLLLNAIVTRMVRWNKDYGKKVAYMLLSCLRLYCTRSLVKYKELKGKWTLFWSQKIIKNLTWKGESIVLWTHWLNFKNSRSYGLRIYLFSWNNYSNI